MRKTFVTLLVILGIALIVVGLSTLAFPQWLTIPGGIVLLAVAAVVGVADFGSKVKDWRDLLFAAPKDPKKKRRSPRSPATQRTQEMEDSDDGEQSMHGRGGVHKQVMKDSPRGKQTMD